MTRATVMRILVIVAIAAVVLVGIRMYNGKPAVVPTPAA